MKFEKSTFKRMTKDEMLKADGGHGYGHGHSAGWGSGNRPQQGWGHHGYNQWPGSNPNCPYYR